MSEKDPSLTDPDVIREQVQDAVAKEASHRPVDVEPSEIPTDDTEIAPDFAPGITVTDVEDAFRWKNVGDGGLAVKLLRGKICFDAIAEKPYRFNCTHWLRDKNSNWRKALFQVADLYAIRSRHYVEEVRRAEERYEGAGKDEKPFLGIELKRAQKISEAWIKRVNACRDMSYVRKIWESSLSGDGSLAISGDEWNQHPTLLPCKNVVVDLETGKLLKPDPFQYFNRAAAFHFHSLHDDAPFFMETISKALMRNEKLIDYFDHMVGFAATGMQTKDFFLAYGPKGDNAKSVVFEWLRKALGDFAGTIKVESLLEERFMRSADGPSPSMLKLRGLRLAVTSEADKKHQFNMGKIKALTSGGDRLEARGINAVDIVEFNPEMSLVLHSNFLPSATGSDEAFFKRVKVLPFRAKFISQSDGPEDPEIRHGQAGPSRHGLRLRRGRRRLGRRVDPRDRRHGLHGRRQDAFRQDRDPGRGGRGRARGRGRDLDRAHGDRPAPRRGLRSRHGGRRDRPAAFLRHLPGLRRRGRGFPRVLAGRRGRPDRVRRLPWQ